MPDSRLINSSCSPVGISAGIPTTWKGEEAQAAMLPPHGVIEKMSSVKDCVYTLQHSGLSEATRAEGNDLNRAAAEY